MKLTANFSLDEFVVSQTAARLGLDNTPPPEVIENLRRLCVHVLEPLRANVGRPVVISSGYRAPAVNRAVGGARGSEHLTGCAADLSVPGMSVAEVCRRIAQLRLPFNQLIDEFGAWVHVSIAPVDRAPRREQLTARRQANGATVYTPANFDR